MGEEVDKEGVCLLLRQREGRLGVCRLMTFADDKQM